MQLKMKVWEAGEQLRLERHREGSSSEKQKVKQRVNRNRLQK